MRTPGLLAKFVKWLFYCRLPVLSHFIIWVFVLLMKAYSYGQPLTSFDSLLSFFLRKKDLSVKMRTQRLVDGLTSPAESTITFLGKLSHNDTMPIKGAGFTVAKLLGRPSPEYISGCVFYLSPGNYHYVHAPCDMVVH